MKKRNDGVIPKERRGKNSKKKAVSNKKVRKQSARKKSVPRRKRKDGKPYSKSDERIRDASPIMVRVSDEEKALIQENAANARWSTSAYLRMLGMKKRTPGPNSKRQPHPTKKELNRIQGQLGKIGSNINQLAHQANIVGMNDTYKKFLKPMQRDISDIRAVIKALLDQ